MKTAFHNYTVNKKYNTRFGDVVPLLCTNALGFNIVILNDSYNVSPKVVFSKSESQACVFIYKKGDHYDGLILMEHIYHDSREPLWQSGLTHDSNAFSNKLLIRNKSDDSAMLSSSNGDDTEDSTEDFIYRLRMHRKSNPTNLIAGFLNINSIRNKFSVQHILCNSYVDLLGVTETKLNHTFPDGQFHVDNDVLNRKDRT